jgi:vacuolar-type H+-ATPase catalytic subunit A/Vma1
VSSASASDADPPPQPTLDAQISAQVQAAIQAASDARALFLKQQQDLRSGLADADQAGRAIIREQLEAAREQFLTEQRQARADLRSKIEQLKEILKQHKDVLDAAKAQAKEAVHARKGD